MADFTISVYHDTRREKEGSVYPVKLRVYHDYKTRFYPTGIDLTKDDFKASFLAEKPKGNHKDTKADILSDLARAQAVADDLRQFDLEKFEKGLLRPATSKTDVFYHYIQKVDLLKSEGRISTASNYDLSAKSIKSFLKDKGRNNSILPFGQITPTFLNDYERWMLKEGKERTTVGIYLRPLRALFNAAIEEGDIDKDTYPFGKRKFQIPQGRNIKKALNKEDLKKLFAFDASKDTYIEKARDFWFFSYVCNGMNIRDIAELRYKNLNTNSLQFIRTKTKNTTKSNSKPIVVALEPFGKTILAKYGNKHVSPETYVFPILHAEMNETEKHRAVQAFTRYINQHVKRLAEAVGVDPNISTYWARHTFTTVSVHNGASLEFIQESLGHGSMTTTMNYWKGFEENVKQDNANKLMDF